MIETIENRVKLLGSMAGLKSDEINTNLSNISIKMEKATIALASVLIGVEDLDLVATSVAFAQRLCRLVSAIIFHNLYR